MKPPFAAVLTAMCLVSPNVDARGGGGGQSGGHSGGGHATSAGHHTGSSRSASTAAKHRSGTALGVQRDKRGKIARSEHAKDEFKKSHP